MASKTASTICGTWILEKNENFDEFLKELGINFILRKAAKVVVPTIIIKDEGNNRWSFKSRSTFKNTDDEYKIGEEFNEVTQDGRKVKSLIKIEGNKLILEQRNQKTLEMEVLVIKEVNDQDKLVEEMTCRGVKAVRIFKRAE